MEALEVQGGDGNLVDDMDATIQSDAMRVVGMPPAEGSLASAVTWRVTGPDHGPQYRFAEPPTGLRGRGIPNA